MSGRRGHRSSSPPQDPAQKDQRQRQLEYNRLRLQMLVAWKELEKRTEDLTGAHQRRVGKLVRATTQLFKVRGSQLPMQYLGPTALGRTRTQSRSSHKRAKRQVFDVYTDKDGNQLQGLGLLRRVHCGGGRLAKRDGGGRHGDDRHRGNADGVMVGPAITGWSPEEYRRLVAGPPPAPASGPLPGEDPETYAERIRRDRYLASRGLQVAQGP